MAFYSIFGRTYSFRITTSAILLSSALVAQAAPISLSELYRETLQKSEGARLQEVRALQAEENVAQARGAIFPALSLQGNFTRLHKPDRALVTFQNQTHFLRANLTQPVFQGLREFAYLSSLKAESRAENHARSQQAVELFRNVSHRFIELQMIRKDRESLQKLVDLSAQRVKEIQSRTRIGRSRATDLLSGQAQLLQQQASLQRSEEDELAIVQDLIRLTSWTDFTQTAAVKGVVPEQVPPLHYFREKSEQSPALQTLAERLAAAEKNIWVSRGAHLPSLELGANYYLDRTGALENSKWDVGLTLTFPLFQGGVISSRTQSAIYQKTARDLELTQAQRSTLTAIEGHYASLVSRKKQLEFTREGLRVAQKNYAEQSRDYRLGLTTNLEVLSAMNTLQEIQRSHEHLEQELILTWIDLHAAAGLIPEGLL